MQQPADPTPFEPLIERIFREYDALALAAYRSVSAEVKADGTTVTRVDRETSTAIVARVQEHYPAHGVLSEEESAAWQPEAEWQWVVDPVDGTASFARGYPTWGLGIGLMWRGMPAGGYLRFPALDETLMCDGRAVRLNGKPLPPVQAEPPPDTQNYLVDSSLHRQLDAFSRLTEAKLRVFGSNLYHMASLAVGRAEAMISGRSYLWDLAAGLPMTRARGMGERYVDGRPFDLSELDAATGYRLPRPLIIGPPERLDHLVRILNGGA